MSWYIAKGIRVAEKTLLEQYPSGIPPFVEEVILRADHDAALRRAKAEVLELAARELCMYCNDPGNWAPMSNSGYHQCNTPGPNMTRCGATKIHALRRELDARAAQIEEGE